MQNKFTIQQVRDFWDSVADEYDEINKKIGPAHYQRFTESLNFLELTSGNRILNIWSRTGNAVPYLTQTKSIELVNMEVAPKMLKIAQHKFPQSRFMLTDLDKLDFSDNFFDAILSLETLEHAPDPEGLLKEFFRILKPGRRLVISLPPRIHELPLRIYGFLFKNHGEGPHKFLPSKTVKKMIKNTGFELILHKGTLLFPAGPDFFQNLAEKIIEKFQQTPVKELGIRQFYVCRKPN